MEGPQWEVLYLARNNPWQQYRVGSDGLESSSAQKALGVLPDSKLIMTQQSALATRRAKSLLHCTSREGCTPASTSREIILFL